jgi:hypothetical protein
MRLAMALLAALLASPSALAAAPPPKPHPPAPAKPPPPAHKGCKKHLTVTFAVYQDLQLREMKTNGCWTAEGTVQERGRYAICHFQDKVAPARRPVAIYDDVNPSHPGELGSLEQCARSAAEKELWEYLTPPFVPVVRGFHKLTRIYAELYDSGTRSPMPYLAQWRRKKRIGGRHVWPMIDVSEHSGSARAIARAVKSICAELPDHGILGIYSKDPVTRAPPKDKALYQKECVDRTSPKSQHCNGRRTAIEQALDACTGK